MIALLWLLLWLPTAVLCGFVGAAIAEQAKFSDHPWILGGVVGGILHVMGLGILLAVWAIKTAEAFVEAHAGTRVAK